MEQLLWPYATNQSQKPGQEISASGDAAAESLEPFLDKEYRNAYLDGYIKGSIALQIRYLRNKLRLSQVEFAKKMGMTQSVVSRLEDAEYGNVTVNTLLRVALENNIGLSIRFTDYMNVVNADVMPQSLTVDDIFESYDKLHRDYPTVNTGGHIPTVNDTAIFVVVSPSPSPVLGSNLGGLPWPNTYPRQLPPGLSSTPIRSRAFETLNTETSTLMPAQRP